MMPNLQSHAIARVCRFLYMIKKVLTGGCFDILHFGHITFLKQAKTLGDHLIVALESDGNVKRVKGDMRPIHTQEQRKAMLEALSCVDEIIRSPSHEQPPRIL